MNHPTPMPYTEPSLRQTLHHDTLFPHTCLLLSCYLVIPCSLVSLHQYCTHCSFLVTLYTFPRYLGSLSCTHYLILYVTNAPLILFLCSSSLSSVSWLSPAPSCRLVWLSLSLPAPVEPCSHLATNLAMPQYFTLPHEFHRIPPESCGISEFHWESPGVVGMYNSCGFPWISIGIPVESQGNYMEIPE